MRIEWRADANGGRQVAYMGEVQVGAVIVDDDRSARWAFWLPNRWERRQLGMAQGQE